MGSGKTVVERTEFPRGDVFRYELSCGEDVGASFNNGVLQVRLSADRLASWADGSEVSIRVTAGPLSILVEKDFECLHKDAASADDNADTFPHPGSPGRTA